jgi:tetratricopeptide (TPR) repeat protein
VLYRQGDLDGAVEMAKSALATFTRAIGPDHQRTTIVQNNLAAFQSQLGDHAGSARQHRDLVAKRARLFGPRNAMVAFSMSMLANELIQLDSIAAAERLLLQSIDIQREAHAPPAQMATTLRVYGDLKHRAGDQRAALTHYADALSITRSVLGPTHRDVAVLLSKSGAAYESLGDTVRAESSYREAAAAAVAAKGWKRAVEVRLTLADLLGRAHRRDAALAELAAVDTILSANDVKGADSLRMVVQRARSALH